MVILLVCFVGLSEGTVVILKGFVAILGALYRAESLSLEAKVLWLWCGKVLKDKHEADS